MQFLNLHDIKDRNTTHIHGAYDSPKPNAIRTFLTSASRALSVATTRPYTMLYKETNHGNEKNRSYKSEYAEYALKYESQICHKRQDEQYTQSFTWKP